MLSAAVTLRVFSRDRTEHRRLLLVGAVRAAETLDRRVGLPARFQQVMHPLALVAAAAIGVIAAPGAAGIGEDQDALVIIHEGGCLGEIRRGGTRLDAEPVATLARALYNPPRASGDLGDEIRAEAVEDLIERALHRRQ
jgi:hypothetical protein